MTGEEAFARLGASLRSLSEPLAVAVSGGVDSLSLALALVRLDLGPEWFHAVSPAVPPRATERVRAAAAREAITVHIVSAAEFEDPRYVANPVDRCFTCKSRLYEAIRRETDRTIASGTNTDDLDDFRPGLRAAELFGVRHPFVEAGISKAGIRELARSLGYGELSDLPASPCLSSRIQTGVQIQPSQLRAVDRVERWIVRRYRAHTVRCRVGQDSVCVELDAASLDELTPEDQEAITRFVQSSMPSQWRDAPVHVAPYRRGSAFLVGAER